MKRWRASLRLASSAALALLLGACGSQEQGDRNNTAMDAELRAANARIGKDDGGRRSSSPVSADAAGQRMRAASTQPPR